MPVMRWRRRPFPYFYTTSANKTQPACTTGEARLLVDRCELRDRCRLNAASDNVNPMELVKMPEQIRKLAYSIAELAEISGIGRSFLYEEIKAGRLVVTKAGRRSLVLYDDALAWLTTLPKLAPTPMSRRDIGV
jgi:excisionase family DNA binding protein